MPAPIFSPERLQEALSKTPELASQEKQAPKKGVGWPPYAAAVGGQAADAISSLIALNQDGKFKEVNPMYSWMGDKAKIGLPIIKGLQTALTAGLMRKLQQEGRPKAAKVVGYLVGAAGAIPAAWNTRLMLKNR